MASKGMRPAPPEFCEAFEPGLNPFSIQISKIFPSKDKTTDALSRKAYLIKVSVVLTVPIADRSYLNSVLGAIRHEKRFCNIWTPRVSETYVDEYGAYSELLCYLHIGKEGKLVHLDKVIKASPVFGRGPAMTRVTEENQAFVQAFMDHVKGGKNLEQAMEVTVKAVPMLEFGEGKDEEGEEDGAEEGTVILERISKISGKGSKGFGEDNTYIIGKVVIVDGKTGEKLRRAEKKVERDMAR